MLVGSKYQEKLTENVVQIDNLFKSPLAHLLDGLPIASQVAEAHYQELIILALDGYIRLEQRPGLSGYYLTLTESGLRWNAERLRNQHSVLAQVSQVLEKKITPVENKSQVQPVKAAPSEKRFGELKAGDRFKILVKKLNREFGYRKVNDTEEDNSVTDTETPEPCSFPENQPVFLVQ
jgi:hypothetical protein